jgi:hypothetical protein
MANQYTSKSFTTYSDPGHGWLKVSFGDLNAVGLEASNDFSGYSYWKQQKNYKAFVYLEEDCDAEIFLAAYYGKNKAMPLIKNRNSNGTSKIRGFNRLPKGERFDANMTEAAKVWREMRESEAV